MENQKKEGKRKYHKFLLTTLLLIFLFVISVSAQSLEKNFSFFDTSCKQVSSFKSSCIIQTERDDVFPCHLEDFSIVCNRKDSLKAMTWKSKQDRVVQKEYEEDGVPFKVNDEVIGHLRFSEKEVFDVKSFGKGDVIKIGFNTNTFVIQDFYWGTCNEGDNCTIDVGVELKPTDSEISLPQSNNLVGRWDFVNDATDTSGEGNDGTVSGATHTYERYEFDGYDDYIDLTGFTSTSKNYTFSFWAKSDQPYESLNYLFDSETGRLIIAWFTGTSGKIGWYDGSWKNIANAPNDGDWHHLVFVLDESTSQGKLYQDGVLLGNDSYTGLNIGDIVHIGESYTGSARFNGSIENVYIWNTTLTATEISNLYNQTRFNTSGNTQTYSGKFTGGVLDSGQSVSSWTALNWSETEPAGTSVELRYRLGNYSKIDETDDDLVSLWKLNRSDGTDAFGSSNPDDNQVLHMKFNSVNDFTDYSGQGNDGTNTGSAYTQEGYIRGARSFDGTDDYVDTPLDMSNVSEMSISVWFKSKEAARQTVVSQWDGTGKVFALSYEVYAGGNKEASFWVYNGSDIKSISNDIPLNQWTHIVGVYNGSSTSIYQNGKKIDSDPCTGNLGINTNNVYIGEGMSGVFPNYVFNGLIDNIRIYNTSLNSTQVKELYSKEAGTYDSINDNHGTAYNGTSRDSGIFESDGALHFDGVDDCIAADGAGSLINPVNGSVIAWIKLDDLATDGYFFRSNSNVRTYLSTDSGRIRLGKGNPVNYYYYNNPVVNKWYQVGLTWENASATGGTMRSYIDGELKDTDTFTNANQATDVNIGCFDETNLWTFNGTIDSIAIYNRTLTPTEIADLYTTWDGWSSYDDTSPTTLTGTGRILQYQARLNTTNNSNTPVLEWVNITYEASPWYVNLFIEDYGMEWIKINWSFNANESDRDLEFMQYSSDNNTWHDFDYIDQTIQKSYAYNLQEHTLYYLRAKGDSVFDELVYLNIITKSSDGDDSVLAVVIMLSSVGLLFLFLTFKTKLKEFKWPLKTLTLLASFGVGIILMNVVRLILYDYSGDAHSIVVRGLQLIIVVFVIMFFWYALQTLISFVKNIKFKFRGKKSSEEE